MIDQGIYLNLSSEDYHNDKNSISRSALMDFKRNQRKYWAKHFAPEPIKEEPTPAMEFGTAFHTMILEPNLFGDRYFVLPQKVYKKDNPELYAKNKELEEEAETTSKKVLSQKDFQTLYNMEVSLFHNERASQLLSGAIYESSYFWLDEHSGLMVKSRPDILHPNLYVDLKTTDDASPEGFQRSMVKGGYHIQAAMARDGVMALKRDKLDACINICVETKPPHCIGIYIIDEAAIEAGHCEYKQLLIDLKNAMHDNTFSDYPVQTIGLPKWAT